MMKDADTLKKAIEKARDNGWDLFGWPKFQVVMGGVGFYEGYGDFILHAEGGGNLEQDFTVIFNHDFAKAFWGADELDCDCSHKCKCWVCLNGWEQFPKAEVFKWQFHLQQMVLEEDPIKYLERFI